MAIVNGVICAAVLLMGLFISVVEGSLTLFSGSEVLVVTLSPPYSMFIGAQGLEDSCSSVSNVALVSWLYLEESEMPDLCAPLGSLVESSDEVEGMVVMIPDMKTGFGGFCSLEHRFLRLTNDFKVAAVVGVISGVPGAGLYAQDGSMGANTLGDQFPPFLEITSFSPEIENEIKNGAIFSVTIDGCDPNPWKPYFDGAGWKALNIIDAISYFGVVFVAFRNILAFRNKQKNQSRNAKDLKVIMVILSFVAAGSIVLILVFSLGFAYSTPAIPFGSATAFLSLLSGVEFFSIFLNALYFREYANSFRLMRAPQDVFVHYRIPAIAGATVLLGVDTARQIGATVYVIPDAISTLLFFLITYFLVAVFFLRESEIFLRVLRNSAQSAQTRRLKSMRLTNATTPTSPHTSVSPRMLKQFGDMFPSLLLPEIIVNLPNPHRSIRQSGPAKSPSVVILPGTESSLMKTNNAQIHMFFVKMICWLRLCSTCQFVWVGVLLFGILGFDQSPYGDFVLSVMACIARFGMALCQAKALTPQSPVKAIATTVKEKNSAFGGGGGESRDSNYGEVSLLKKKESLIWGKTLDNNHIVQMPIPLSQDPDSNNLLRTSTIRTTIHQTDSLNTAAGIEMPRESPPEAEVTQLMPKEPANE